MGLELIGTHALVFVLGVVAGATAENWSKAAKGRRPGPRR